MSFDTALHLVITYGYLLIFILMIVEGPIISIVSAFAAALGFFNIYTIFILALVGNLIPDLIYYCIGFWGRKSVIDKYRRFWKIKDHHLDNIEKISSENFIKSLIVIKLVPFFAMPGLVTAGAMKIKFKKYFLGIVALTMINSFIYLLIGYNIGTVYRNFEKYFDFKFYLIFALIILLWVIIYFYRKIMSRVVKIVEKN